jgi:hypothetical protein
MKTAPRKKTASKPQTVPDSGQPCIIYSPTKVKTATHGDFCRRWFGVVDMSDAIGKHYAPILSTHGEHFEFRIARFYNFRDIKTEEPRTIVRCLETGEVWILKPNWAQSLTRTDENTKQTIILIPQPVKNYRQILGFMKLFYSDGETMKRLISIGRIKEILK